MVPTSGLASGMIIAAAFGYQWSDVAAFVISALQNTKADLLLMVDSRQQSLLQVVSGFPRVHTVSMKLNIDPKGMVVRRFFLIRDLLDALDASPVLLSDSRDVVFQGDPFLWSCDAGSSALVFAEESSLIGRCPVNRSWVDRFFGENALSLLENNYVLCAGTMLGPKNLMSQFLTLFCELMENPLNPYSGVPWGLDQSALNFLVRRPEFSLPAVFENASTGRFLTLYHEARCNFDVSGRLVNGQGAAFPVVHQYDRMPWLEKHIRSRLLVL